MAFDYLWRFFENRVFNIPSSDRLFNQYRDRNAGVDLSNAAEIRRKNLFRYFGSFKKRPSVVLIGEAPGPWGCRFSGIPFTGERQLLMRALPFVGRQSSKDKPLLELRKRPPYVSNSARLFWGTMLAYHPNFFVWNCVPFHPYAGGNILSVRTPTSGEVLSYADILSEILSLLKPERTIAVGRKAQFSLEHLGIPCDYVRHPSQGGAIKFKNGIKQVFKML
jgi:uracil-DNA glycosylase